MEQLRGRVPLNIDYKNNYNASTYAHPEKAKDLHHNQNYNIFEDPVYVPSKMNMDNYSRERDPVIQTAVDYV